MGEDLVNRLDTDEGFEDLYPTGEHSTTDMVELAGSDLEEISHSHSLEDDTPAVDDIPTPVAMPSGFPPREGTLSLSPQGAPKKAPNQTMRPGMTNMAPSPAPYSSLPLPTPYNTAPAPYGPAASAPSPYGPAASAPSPYGPAASAPSPYGPAASAPSPYGPAASAPSPTLPSPFDQPGPPPDLRGLDDDYDLGLEPLENAPTRIEREDMIRGAGEGELPHMGPRLVIIGGNNRGKEFAVQRRDNSLGRGMDNDVILADIAVSRKHTLICYEGENFVLRDLGSGNGTLLNGLRVDSAPLKDGDQIELGNTLIRFLSPDHIEHVPPIASAQTVVTVRGDSLDSPTKKGGTAVSFTPRRGRSKRKRLLLFGVLGVVVFLGVMAGIKFLLLPRANKPEVVVVPQISPDVAAAKEWQQGISLFNNHDFEQARTHFLKALALAPANDHIVRQYVDKTTSELKAKKDLDEAEKKLATGEFKAARDELIKISSDSFYHEKAGALAQKVDDKQVSELVTEAKDLQTKGEKQEALEKIKQAQAIAPTHNEVKELYAELSTSGSSAAIKKTTHVRLPRSTPREPITPRPQPRPTPRAAPQVSGRQAKEAITLYSKRQWEEARQAFIQLGSSQTGKKQEQSNSMAKHIQIVGKSWSDADKAPDLKQRLKLYLKAFNSDKAISGGHHQAALKDKILKATILLADLSIKRSKYDEAYYTIKVGVKYCGEDPGLKELLTSLEKKANEYFNMGYTVRTSNPARARKFWSKVIRMVPPSSDVYQKAYQYLNSAGPSYQDEDEE